MFILALSLLCLSVAGRGAAAASDVVINEFEQNPAGEDAGNEWVELFNPTNQAVNVSGWMLVPTRNRIRNVTLEAGSIIPPLGYLVVPPPQSQWLDNEWEIIALMDSTGNVKDNTTRNGGWMTDERGENGDDYTWQRFPNGQDTDSDADWAFRPSTKNLSNGGEPVTTTTTTTTSPTTTTTTQQQVTTTTTQTTTQQTTTTTQQTATATTQVEPGPGIGFAIALMGIGAAAAAAGGGIAVATSGRQHSQVFTYGGYYYCAKHRVPVWDMQGYFWCPVERRYLRP
jgi:hypothetical protein